jgi:5-methyltetrahydropteroyltriglutamate--homocysteine methyltransferase
MWMPPSEEPISTFGLPASRAGWVCTGEVRYVGTEALREELKRFKGALAQHSFADAFVPSGSPTVVEFGARNAFYPTREQYIFAIAEAMREEYRAIVDSGFILQVDAPEMPDAYDRMAGAGSTWDEYLRYAEMSVEATNVALDGIPEDRVRYHICWGSWNGPHTNDVPLRDILHLVLKVKAQTYYVEAANPRHEHEWQVWEEAGLPDGKIIMPGVIAHTTNVIEHPEVVAQRIERYASMVGRENVIAATDCGFSQGWNSPRVHPEVQWAKLAALTEGATLASRRLWT